MFSLEFSEMQEQVRDTFMKFAREEIAPTVIVRDVNAVYPAAIGRIAAGG